MERLAIFDVDFTLTSRETLIEFYLFVLKKNPRYIKYLPSILGSALFYGCKIYDEKKVKERVIAFINGIDEKEIQKTVKEFYKEVLNKILYKDSLDMIKKLKGQGYKIILISASPELYLKELYNIKEVDFIIGSRFHCSDGKYKNKMTGENCKGEEKVKRLSSYIESENIEVDFKESHMFSDSLADVPLLELVGHPHLINFRKKHNKYEILNWK
ncbi:MAG: HAD-IB family hydrolase [Clostridium sp.]